jgi:alpha-N-arabinofuranosidase
MTARTLSLLGGVLAGSMMALAQPSTQIHIDAGQTGPRINKAMWGVFIEDINFAGDGGLHAELVKNRSFEFNEPMMGWKPMERGGAKGNARVETANPLNANNPNYLRVKLDAGTGGYGLANEGFRGIGVKKGALYDFSVHARTVSGTSPTLRVQLVGADGRVLGTTKVTGITPSWTQRTAEMKASDTDPKAHFEVWLEGQSTTDLDMISLYPRDTWKKRKNGLRADLVQMLADLHPGFVRFPGGCIVEGRTLPLRYQWKNTIGDPAQRPNLINRWNDEFKHKPTPDYYQSFGVGFFEYFLMCEDIGAQPLPILNCGMACQFNSNELVPLNQLDPFIQDCLDLIEFANGPVTSTWGAKRAAMGHPKPFGMKLLGIGNEQWGPQYIERYERHAKVLKARHPEIQLISSAGPDPDGEKFDFLWPKLRALKADLVDEHYYRPPVWFLDNAGRYDKYSRVGPKIFAGEYAAQSVKTASPDNRNNWQCALAEAAMLTGFERNADVVRMASYAPLFGHLDAWQWTPNLIWFDNLHVYGTPNYFVQQLFSRNPGDFMIPVKLAGEPKAENGNPRFYVSATKDAKRKEIILKVVNATTKPVSARIGLNGVKVSGNEGKALTLSAPSLSAENSLAVPRNVSPTAASPRGISNNFVSDFPPQSVTLLRIPVAK